MTRGLLRDQGVSRGDCVMPSPPGNGESFIEMVFNVTKHDKNSFAYGDIEVALVDFSEP